jgi:hypothetical protein
MNSQFHAINNKSRMKFRVKRRWLYAGRACLIFAAVTGVGYSQMVYAFNSIA